MVCEPLFDLVVATTSAVDPITGVELDIEQVFHDTERGDLLLIRGDECLLIDVMIVRPTAPTHLRNARLGVTERGLACATAAERTKRAKYDDLPAPPHSLAPRHTRRGSHATTRARHGEVGGYVQAHTHLQIGLAVTTLHQNAATLALSPPFWTHHRPPSAQGRAHS